MCITKCLLDVAIVILNTSIYYHHHESVIQSILDKFMPMESGSHLQFNDYYGCFVQLIECRPKLMRLVDKATMMMVQDY